MPPGTHTQSWDWGRPGRPAGPRGTPAAVARKPRGQARGPGLSPALAALSAPPARGAALPGATGRFQFRLRDPGCTLRPEGQPEEGRRGHRPGRTCRPAAPRLQLLVPNPRTGAPTALHPALPELTALKQGLSPTALSPRTVRFARGVDMAGPLGTRHSHKQGCVFTVRNAHTDTCQDTPPADALSTVPPFPVPAAPRPMLWPFLSCPRGERTEEDSSQTWGGQAQPCGQRGALFSQPTPGSPK